jgi:predicted ATPase
MARNNWYVITGGPSTGKTTLLSVLRKRGYKTLPESARVLIDEAKNKGVSPEKYREDEKKFQMDVLRHKVKLEKELDSKQLTFFDRGMHDTLAYIRLIGEKINQEITDAVSKANYKKVFLLERLGGYEKDYARTETAAQARQLDSLLYEAYDEAGITPIIVPIMKPKERAEFVLHHISEDTKLS